MRQTVRKILRFCAALCSVVFFAVSVLTYIYPAEMVSFAEVGVSARVGSASPSIRSVPRAVSVSFPLSEISGAAQQRLAVLIYLIMSAFVIFSLLVILDYYADIYLAQNKYEINDRSLIIKK